MERKETHAVIPVAATREVQLSRTWTTPLASEARSIPLLHFVTYGFNKTHMNLRQDDAKIPNKRIKDPSRVHIGSTSSTSIEKDTNTHLLRMVIANYEVECIVRAKNTSVTWKDWTMFLEEILILDQTDAEAEAEVVNQNCKNPVRKRSAWRFLAWPLAIAEENWFAGTWQSRPFVISPWKDPRDQVRSFYVLSSARSSGISWFAAWPWATILA